MWCVWCVWRLGGVLLSQETEREHTGIPPPARPPSLWHSLRAAWADTRPGQGAPQRPGPGGPSEARARGPHRGLPQQQEFGCFYYRYSMHVVRVTGLSLGSRF